MVFRATDIREFLSCRRRYYFSKVLRLKKIEDTDIHSNPTLLGSIGHKVLELSESHPTEDTHTLLRQACNFFNVEMDDETHKFWFELLNNYRLYISSRPKWENVHIEKTLEYTLPNNHVITGQLDKLGIYQGRLWIRDYKFLSRLPSTKALEMDIQMSIYLLLASKLGENPAGAYFTIIQKKLPKEPQLLASGMLSVSRTTLDNTTYHCYKEAIKRHGLDENEYMYVLDELRNRAITEPPPNIHEIIIRRNQIELSSLEEQLVHITNEIARLSDPQEYYICPSDSCSYCQYFMLCKHEMIGGVTEPILNMYTRKENER